MRFTILAALTVIGFTTDSLAQGFNLIGKELHHLPDNINSDAEEIMPMIGHEGEDLYFVRAVHADNAGGIKGGHDIWKATKTDKRSEFSNPDHSFKKLNNAANNAVVGVSKGDKKLYVLNAYHKETKQDHGIATVNNDGKWKSPEYVKIQNMDYNSKFYGFYINPEETVMFISMKGPNSLGEEDLYISVKENNEWQQPVHLGNNINSAGFEMSPSISADGKRLYFSSNGHGGHGDADIFYSERIGDDWLNWSAPKNMEAPINSEKFDAYFVEGPNMIGYFASNRENVHSDLFSVQLELISSDTALEDTPVAMVASVPDMQPDVIEIDEPSIVAKPSFKDVNFDNSSAEIKPSDKSTLDKLATYLSHHPTQKVTISGYSDATWTDSFNLQLSQRRAKTVRSYLISKGVKSSQITVKYFGEKHLKVNTEEENESNRRVEFTLD